MTDAIQEQFDAIAERIGARARQARETPHKPAPTVTERVTEHLAAVPRPTATENRHPGARRTVIIDDDTEGSTSRLETHKEYLSRLAHRTMTAHSREIGRGGHDDWATFHLRWLYAEPGIIGMAWVEASVTGTFGYWHLGERCGLVNEAQLIPSLEGQPVDAVTSIKASDWREQCEVAIDALDATVARHLAAKEAR